MNILLKNKNYLFLAIIVALASGYLLYKFSSMELLLSMNTSGYIFLSLSTSVIIAILFGINVSLITYKFNMSRKLNIKEDSSSVLGLFGGVLASGCPVCGVGLLTLLGVSGGLAVFPFEGLELKVLSIALLLYSTYKVSGSMSNCKECVIGKK